MSGIMACCGLLCSECMAYKATVADDMSLRDKTAEQWSRMFGAEIKPEQINCMGCNSDVLFTHCHVCEVRACVKGNALGHCGRCRNFACDKVENVLKYDEGARERLSRTED